MKRRGGPTEDDVGNGNHQITNQIGNSTGNRIETARDGGPRVAAAKEEDYNDIARALLTKDEFYPDDLNKVSLKKWSHTPLIYYSYKGNVTMCRYLIARGADCQKTDDTFGFSPLYVAAIWGHLEIMKLLFYHGGAQEDIGKGIRNAGTALRVALLYEEFDVVHLLILIGALAPRDDVDDCDIDDAIMRRDLSQEVRGQDSKKWNYDHRLTVLARAQDTVTNHDNVQVFLEGTILSLASFRRHPKNPYATRSSKNRKVSSPPVVLKGNSGILALIAQYVAGTPQQVRMLRQLIDRLPAFIADVPFVVVEEDEEEDEDEEDEDEVDEDE